MKKPASRCGPSAAGWGPAPFFLALTHLLALTTPYLIKLVIDDAIAPGRPDLLWVIGAAGIVLYALTSITRFWGQWLTDKHGEQVWLDLRNQLYDHLQGLSLRYHGSHRIGHLIGRVHSDAFHIKQIYTSVIPGMINVVVTVGGTGIILLVLAPRLVLLALIPLPAALLIGYLFRNRIRPLSQEKMQLHGEIYSTLQESLSGIEDIKIYRGEGVFKKKLAEQGQRLMDAELRLAKDRAKLFPILDFSISFVLLGALVVGGHMVMAETLTIGTLVVFYYYIARALGPIRSASGIVFSWYSATAAMERINELLSSDEHLSEPAEPRELKDRRVGVALEGVTFHYEDLDTGKRFCALDNVSLEIPVGSRVALLGPSGSGKSTTGKLLARLFDPEEGVITMGGVPLPELSLDDLRGRIGYVGQEVFLFNGTIEENIRFGSPREISDEDVERVVKLAKVDEILEHKELGLMTPVGEKGARLSGGQKKRIALARALLREPSILIIDQLASDLEEELNRSIFEGIREELDLSILYLGHRVPAGFGPDAVYWMEYGRPEKRQVDKEIA